MQSLGNLFGCNRLDHIWKDKESNNADDYRKNDDDGENFFCNLHVHRFLFYKKFMAYAAQKFFGMDENAA